MRRRILYLFLLIVIVSVPNGYGQNPHNVKGFDKWSVWTGGTKLRGANIWQSRAYKGTFHSIGNRSIGPLFTQKDFDELSTMGANYVNISHPGIFTESEPFLVDKTVHENLNKLLKMIEKADMFAVICFRTGPGRSEFTFSRDEAGDWFKKNQLNETVWKDIEKQDAWVDMWHRTAILYKDNPIVAGYDLMVEPNSNELVNGIEDPWDPEEFYPKYKNTMYDWNQLYPRLVEAIRRVDPQTPILIGSMCYSSSEWIPYLTKCSSRRIVYTVHQYEPYEQYTHQSSSGKNTYPGRFDLDYDGSPDHFNKNWLNSLLATVDDFSLKNMPIVVNEFGVIRWVHGAASYMKDSFDLFEQRGWNHALWAWYPASYPASDLEGEFYFMLGPKQDNKTRISSSPLIQTIKTNWARNTIRPSNTIP